MRRKTGVLERTDPTIYAGLFAMLISLLFRLPLMSVIGENGIGYFAAVNEILLLSTLFISGGVAESLHSMIKYRVKREQYRSAKRIFRRAIILTIGYGIVVCLLLLVLSGFVAEVVALERLSHLAIYTMAPAVVFLSLTGLLRGYFQGMGSKVPTVHSLFLEQVLSIGLGIFLAFLGFRYGEKVAAVLQDYNFAAVYGAMGVFAGISVAALLSFLHLFLIYLLYRGTVKKQMYRDSTKTVETDVYLYRSLLVSALPEGILAVLLSLNTLVDQRIFNYSVNILARENSSLGQNKAEIWGNYYGVYLVFIGIFTVGGCFLPGRAAKGIILPWAREEYRVAKEQLTITVNTCLATVLPLTVFVAALAEPLGELFGQGDGDLVAQLIPRGSLLIFFGVFSYLWIGLLKQLRKIGQLLLIGAGGFLIHLAALFLLLLQAKTAEGVIHSVVYGNVISGAAIFAAGFVMVARIMQFRQDWLKRCVRPLITAVLCAGIAGVIAILLKMAIFSLVGPAVTVIICLVVAITAYLILMILLRGLSEEEFMKMPSGNLILRLARLMRFM